MSPEAQMSENCWYAEPLHQPWFAFCPPKCNGAPVTGEHMGGGVQRYYCEEHTYWRSRDAPRAPMRPLV